MARGIPTRLSAAEGRRFGLTVGVAFAVLAAIVWWRDKPAAFTGTLASLSGALILAGLLVPSHLGPVFRAWMKFAELLSRVTTPIVMAILFYLVFLPIGALMRLTGKNPIRQAAPGQSAWHERAPGARRGELQRQF